MEAQNILIEPVVTEKTNLLREEKAAKYAFKVNFWDVDAMADDIYALIKYPALADFAAKKGFDEVNALKWDHAAAKLKDIYYSLVK